MEIERKFRMILIEYMNGRVGSSEVVGSEGICKYLLDICVERGPFFSILIILEHIVFVQIQI